MSRPARVCAVQLRPQDDFRLPGIRGSSSVGMDLLVVDTDSGKFAVAIWGHTPFRSAPQMTLCSCT